MSDISVIVPTRNRSERLYGTLVLVATVVEASRHPVEIIVVDNGSIDDTVGVCREIRSRFPKQNWRYFYDETPGLLTGRHLGAREAQGEILAYLDDDVLLTPSWLEALNEAFSEPEVMLAGGPTCPQYEVEPPPWLDGMWEEFEEGVRVLGELSLVDLGPNKKEVNPLYIPGANLAIRKAALQECGGFHPDLMPKPLQRYHGNGENGLEFKIKARGLKALYHPGAAVRHVIPASRLTVESFEKKGFHQGVEASFSSIRRKGFVPVRTKSLKDHMRPIKWKLERPGLLRNLSAKNLRFLIARARFAGRWFHEREVRKDTKLLAWVLKPDYFDYRLPDGWKSYLKSSDSSHMRMIRTAHSRFLI